MFENLPDLLSAAGGQTAPSDLDLYLFERACVMAAMRMTPDEFDTFEMRNVLLAVQAEAVRKGPVRVAVEVFEEDLVCVSSLYFPNDPFTRLW